MEITEPFNPLHKKHLGSSVAEAMLAKPVEPLPPEKPFRGAGIYAIYYMGDFPAYKPIADKNKNNKFGCPIYIGKAVRKGARKGDFSLDASPGSVLYQRLRNHGKSIERTHNLKLKDFRCRYLTVDDIWIPLGESLLIEMFAPLWNKIVDGFGNNDPGSGRYNQRVSSWDILHPGRTWGSKLKSGRTAGEIMRAVEAHLKPN
jgi:hypothetical protein